MTAEVGDKTVHPGISDVDYLVLREDDILFKVLKEAEVVFPEKIENVIRYELGKPTGVLTRADLEKLIGGEPDIRRLSLAENQIDDISPLAAR